MVISPSRLELFDANDIKHFAEVLYCERIHNVFKKFPASVDFRTRVNSKMIYIPFKTTVK